MTISEWVYAHWPELAAALGIGGGGGLIGKGVAEREQNKKINELERRVSDVEKDLEVNHTRDEEFRKSFDEHKKDMKEDLNDIKLDVKTITKHLLDGK